MSNPDRRTVMLQDQLAWDIDETAPVVIPLGSIEQHGPHMPIDTDSFLATAFARSIAEEVGGNVGPGINYGCRSLPVSGGGELFPGTISLQGETFSRVIADLVTAYHDHGHTRIVLVNGHFENTAFAIEGVKRALERVAVQALVIDWWTILPLADLDEIFEGEFPGWEAEHAGVIETSLLMHVAPERVRTEAIENRVGTIAPPNYTVLPEREGLVDPSGVLRTAWGANAPLGQRIFAEVIRRSAEAISAEFRD